MVTGSSSYKLISWGNESKFKILLLHLQNTILGGKHFLGVLKGVCKLQERPFSGPRVAYKGGASHWYVKDEFSRQKLHSRSEQIDFRSELAACQGCSLLLDFQIHWQLFYSPTTSGFGVNLVGSRHVTFYSHFRWEYFHSQWEKKGEPPAEGAQTAKFLIESCTLLGSGEWLHA